MNITFTTDTTYKKTDRVTYRDASHLKILNQPSKILFRHMAVLLKSIGHLVLMLYEQS